ncbi:MAG: carbon-nitrogen hydrolase family protein [Oceanibaculum sp.]
MSARFKVALIQTNSEREFQPNIDFVNAQARAAKKDGADFILTPEIAAMFEPKRDQSLAKAQAEETHPALAAWRDLARELGVWFLAGSLSVKLSDTMLANRSILIDPKGGIQARYDKIHMFDVNVKDGQTYRESATYRPGEKAVLTDLPWGRLGMTICYDLRFAYLYRALARAGADFITIPAAFTRVTGEAHWHVLQRARAIETGCFVFAPAQTGDHAEGRKTYGHSLVVAPWGEVLADAGTEPGFVTAEIDTALVAEARRMVPSLTHDRDFAVEAPAPLRAAGE